MTVTVNLWKSESSASRILELRKRRSFFVNMGSIILRPTIVGLLLNF